MLYSNRGLRLWDDGVATYVSALALSICCAKPFPQNRAFNFVLDDDEDYQVVFVDWRANMLLLKLPELTEHGLLDVLLQIKLTDHLDSMVVR